MKRIFGIGGGGREHALAQAMSKSEGVEQLWAPGNPGIASLPGCSVVDIPVTDLERLAAFASDTRPDLTVVGPEGPLAAGIVDVFRERGLPIIGPTRAAARIETDKLFALMLMHRCGVPTGRYRAFWPTTPEDVADVERYALTVCDWDGRVVIKPNGLTGGKGVRVCTCAEHVRDAIRALTAAYAGAPIVVMEHLGAGQEFSVFALVDSEGCVAILGAAQDHKRRFAGDKGPNTGGMGAYSPVPFVDRELIDEVRDRIIVPTVEAMAGMSVPYTGFLYAGLIMTPDGPQVIEWNCRLGDPEAQVVLPLVEDDLAELLLAAGGGKMREYFRGRSVSSFNTRVERCSGAATCVVLTSEGYPEKPEIGFPISGISEAEAVSGVTVFHAGTRLLEDGTLVTNGGRVLGVTAVGGDVADARRRAYFAAEYIRFKGRCFRPDIGHHALDR